MYEPNNDFSLVHKSSYVNFKEIFKTKECVFAS